MQEDQAAGTLEIVAETLEELKAFTEAEEVKSIRMHPHKPHCQP